MRFDKFTLKVQEAVQDANAVAAQYGHQAVDVEHLLVSLLKQPEGIIPEILKKVGADPASVDRELKKILERTPRVQGPGAGQAYITPA